MNAVLLLIVFLGYFSLIMLIAWLTSRGATSHTFFNANRKSKWY